MKISHENSNGMKLLVENPDEELKYLMIKKIKESFQIELDHLINRVQVELRELKSGDKIEITSKPLVIHIENI